MNEYRELTHREVELTELQNTREDAVLAMKILIDINTRFVTMDGKGDEREEAK
jgi:hypothetical protein